MGNSLCKINTYVISDKDKMEGDEHEDTVKSPPKGVGICVCSDIRVY